MAIIQSNWALRRFTPPRPQSAGAVHVARFEFIFDRAVAIAGTDILELGVLPAFARVLDATFIGQTALVGTANIGIMSGEVGDPSAGRTVDASLFAAADANAAMTRMLLPTAFLLPAFGADRSIGVTFSVAIPLLITRMVTLILEYEQ